MLLHFETKPGAMGTPRPSAGRHSPWKIILDRFLRDGLCPPSGLIKSNHPFNTCPKCPVGLNLRLEREEHVCTAH